jgi:FkbM family methyltransferase
MGTFTSYAQNFEDVLLWRALSGVQNGFYVDIGANSPVVDSVSMAFYERGWRGINVEPSQEYVNELRAQRPRDINLHAAVAAEPGVLTFFNIPSTGLSTLLRDVANRYEQEGLDVRAEYVPAITLDNILSDLPQADVHWMKVDVEGAEKAVLDSWKNCPVRPWIVLVESVRPDTHEPAHEDWEAALVAKGYTFVYFDGLNRYYVSERHAHLVDAFAVAPNVFDRFVLNGTATSTFTALLTYRLQESEKRLAAELRLGEEREQQWQSERARFEERKSEMAAGLLAANQAALEAGRAHEASMRAAKEAARVHEASLLAAQEAAAVREASLRAEFALASEQLHCSIAEAERKKVALQSRLIQTLSEYRWLIQERDNAQAEMRQHAYQLSLARAESDSLKLARKELEGQLQSADHRLAEREEALRVSEARTREVLDSSSWRLTAPLRLLVAMMRGSRQGVSKYLGETLRNASRIPGVRGVAARLVPEHGRLRRYLVARVPPPGPTVLLRASSASMSTVAFGYAGSERSRLVSRMVDATCKEDDVMGLQE